MSRVNILSVMEKDDELFISCFLILKMTALSREKKNSYG